MALTNETLKADEALASLTDDQLNAISTLSKNDEEVVIGAKVGEIHGQYDTDVEAITGVKRADGVKSYDYVKSMLGDYKTKADGAAGNEQKVTDLNTEIVGLKKAIAEGNGDEAIKRQLKDSQDAVLALQGKYDTDTAAWATEKTGWETKQKTDSVNSAISSATTGLKFKAGYPESIQKTLIDSAKAQVLADAAPEFVDVAGKSVLMFRDKAGQIMRNPANRSEPFTASELIAAKLTEVLDTTAGKTGGGTGASKDKPDAIGLVDVAGAKTQTEADDIITAHLLQIGKLRGTTEFSEAKTQIWNDSEISKLPIR